MGSACWVRNGDEPPVPAPERPVQGLRLWVQWGSHWAVGEGFSVTRVTTRSFTVTARGQRTRRPLGEWLGWLRARRAEGLLLLEGRPVVLPGEAALVEGLRVPVTGVVATAAEPHVGPEPGAVCGPRPSRAPVAWQTGCLATQPEPCPEGYSWSELRPLVAAVLQTRLPVLLTGHPGVGKSALAAVLAEDFGLPLRDIRLAQQEPGDLAGVYFPDASRSELRQLVPDWVREVAERPCLLLLDEFNAALSRLHQAVAYQIVLERRLGPCAFHPDTLVLAAGNLVEDSILVTPLASPLSNRFVHLRMRVDAPGWLAWAREEGLPAPLLAYVQAAGRRGNEVLYEATGEDAFPSPRSWAMAGRLLAAAPGPLQRRLIASCVGVEAAERFGAFLRLYRRLDPGRVVSGRCRLDFTRPRNTDPSFIHAALMGLADWLSGQERVEPGWAGHLARWLQRPGLDPEYVAVLLQALRDGPALWAALCGDPDFAALAARMDALLEGSVA